MTEREKMVAGVLYNPENPELKEARLRARELVYDYNMTRPRDAERRRAILGELLPFVDSSAFLEPNIRIEYGFNIHAGKYFYMNFDCQLLDVAPITIGENVFFGPRVTVATPIHPLVAEERAIREYPDGVHDVEYASPVRIGSGVWVGAGATICGGVTIGDGAIIGAGAVVTRDIPANSLAVGVPCRVLRTVTENDRLFKKG